MLFPLERLARERYDVRLVLELFLEEFLLVRDDVRSVLEFLLVRDDVRSVPELFLEEFLLARDDVRFLELFHEGFRDVRMSRYVRRCV